MTESERLRELVAARAEMGQEETSGSDTIARYLYQCKVAVRRWLATLELAADAVVLCEFVDDITTVAGGEITFAQVKTRDRGAWTASKVLEKGGGIASLIRSYNLANKADLAEHVQLELILEGPQGIGADTRSFFADPMDASDLQRTALVKWGLDEEDLHDFLARLKITHQYHARQSIDAATIRSLMGLAPGHSAHIEAIYDKLLERVIAAHIAAAASADSEHPLAFQHAGGSTQRESIEEHALSRVELLTILPPIPTLANEQRQILEAASGGALAMTDLELKLRVAGATDKTIARAKVRRSSAAALIAARPTLGGGFDEQLAQLSDRLIEHADAVTADVVGSAAAVAIASRPAEVIYGRLVQQAARLAQLDREGVLGGDGDLVLGLLCDLSDRCLFDWRET